MSKKIFFLFLVLFSSLFGVYIHAQIISTNAGSDSAALGDGGLATNCRLLGPIGVASDGAGNVYICDRDDHRLRKVNPVGIITTIAGTGAAGYNGDNGPATMAELYSPYGVVVDNMGTIYITDDVNNRIRKINTSGIITTIAGTGTSGYSGDNGPATQAQLNGPGNIVLDNIGNLYFTDGGNNVVRKIDVAGIITTIASNGIGGDTGDGWVATLAELHIPNGLAIDGIGNLYVGEDAGNRVRKINTSGIISTVAGTGVAGDAGDGGAATDAQLHRALGVTTDAYGNIYVADAFNNKIRKVNASGKITTIAGTGVAGYSGDGSVATLAHLFSPVGISANENGDILFADFGNNRVRNIKNTVSIKNINTVTNAIDIYPNPSSGSFIINVNSLINDHVLITITNEIGEEIKMINSSTNQSLPIVLDVPAGIYFLIITSGNGRQYKKISIEK